MEAKPCPPLKHGPDGQSITQVIGTSIDLAGRVIQLAQNVVRYREKCREIARTAAVVQGLLQTHTAALHTAGSGTFDYRGLEKCLRDVESFLGQCASSSNFLQIGLDVVLWQKADNCKEDMLEWLTRLNMEIATSTLAKTHESRVVLGQVSKTINDDVPLQLDQIQHLKSLQQAVEDIKIRIASNAIGGPLPAATHTIYSKTDNRLSLTKDPVSGVLSGTLTPTPGGNSLQVICPKIEINMTASSIGPRWVDIYSQLASGTMVQKFYGILKDDSGPSGDQNLMAILEDLRSESDLSSVILHDASLATDFEKRLQLAYDLSNTVAYMHYANILLKSLSDTSVIVKKYSDGKLEPILTNLESARKFLQATSGTIQDARYEAPEFLKLKRHSKYTDIWSLGILIWQIMFWKFPYGHKSSDMDPTKNTEIFGKIKSGEQFWDVGTGAAASTADNDVQKKVLDLVKNCCATEPLLRPAAATVAQSLLDVISGGWVYAPQDADNLIKVKQKMWEKISRYRSKAETKVLFDPAEFDLLFESAAHYDPVSLFLVGAAVYWEIIEAEDAYNKLAHDLRIGHRKSIDPQVNIPRVALAYLDRAIQDGQEAAKYEAVRAYKRIAKAYTEALEKEKMLQDENRTKFKKP